VNTQPKELAVSKKALVYPSAGFPYLGKLGSCTGPSSCRVSVAGQITERPCRKVNHEYSNKWSPTMSLLSDGLGYGPNLPDGPSAGHFIFWQGGVGPRMLNLSVVGESSLGLCCARLGR